MADIFIIAEAGVNHNGDITLAEKLVHAAADAGADAVKFQTWKTEKLLTREAHQAEYQSRNTGKSESQFAMAKALELDYEDFRRLKALCDERGILFLSTPDEEESADFLASLQRIFKIGSGELDNLPFLRHVATLADEIILSTGMGTLTEVARAVEALEEAGFGRERLTLLHATTDYPAPLEDVNLKAMQTLACAFKTRVGYSDHTMGIEIPIAAAAMGASVIEKHFTLDRGMEGPDHRASLEPHELAAMVEAVRNVEKALGDGIKRPSAKELQNRTVVRKTLVAARPIRKGETFTPENVTLKRAGRGIPAERWDETMGGKAARDYRKDEPL